MRIPYDHNIDKDDEYDDTTMTLMFCVITYAQSYHDEDDDNDDDNNDNLIYYDYQKNNHTIKNNSIN